MTPQRYAFLGFALLVCTPFLYFVFRSDEPIKNFPPKNHTVVAFGDSLVEGVGATEGNDFISAVGRNLEISIINKGKSGDTTATGLSRLQDVLDENPGVVLVLLGGNDAIRRVPKEETFKNLGTIIERLEGSGVVVILLGVRGGILADGYEEDYKTLAKKYQTAYVPNVLEGLITNPDLMYDGIHPNDKGYQIIAERITPVLKDVLK
ncbi:MAG: GDSL-type esterase/lipase family protein [Patescibacteria group bacterium]|mgnify:CR=1 FL=1